MPPAKGGPSPPPTTGYDDDPIVCCCNGIPLSAIVGAMEGGALTVSELFDATWAGCGPCGGTCQPDLQALLDDYLQRVATNP